MALATRKTAGLSPSAKKGLIALAAAIALFVYYPVLSSLAGQWLDDPNYRHGIIIPFISALLVWRAREEAASSEPGGGRAAGLSLMILSMMLLVAGTAASELFTTRISIPLLIAGSVLLLHGRQLAARTGYALLLLFMMVPLPYIIYYKLTFPMQIMSARLSSGVLNAVGVSVIRRGNILMLPGYSLEVVAACSGLRSLMTMVTLALVMAAFSGLGRTRNVLLVACSVPVAVAANTIRLVVTAVGAYTAGPKFADGPLHEVSGLIVFAAGLVLLMICAGVLRWTR